MYVTYDEYCLFGYCSVSEAEFARYELMARKSVEKYTFGTVSEGNITNVNKYGVCELIELYYGDKNQTTRPLAGFSNDGYSEQYAELEKLSRSLDEQVESVIYAYFSTDEIFRGV